MSEQTSSSTIIERTYRAEPTTLWDLWTTPAGFASWWGPQGFRADVHAIDPSPDGIVAYDMVADTPATVAAMTAMAQPTTTACRGRFSAFRPHDHLVLTQVIDFLPGVAPYDSRIAVDFHPAAAGHVRMIVTLGAMHDAATSGMQQQGFLSQLAKLDRRYGWDGSAGLNTPPDAARR